MRITPLSASGFKHHPDADYIALSVDGGRTWTTVRALGDRTWTFPMSPTDPLPRWVEPIAWDADGALYSLWTEVNAVRLARTRDLGKTWQQWQVAETKNTTAFFPYVIARGSGELAATWFTAKMPATLHSEPIWPRFERETAPMPIVRTSQFEIDAITANGPTPAGEYVPVAFLRSGRLTVVTPVQNRPTKRLGFSYWTVSD